MRMFLDDEELVELTGRKQKKTQINALNLMGVKYEIRPSGTIAVLRDHVQIKFGGLASIKPEKKEFTPRWDLLNATPA